MSTTAQKRRIQRAARKLDVAREARDEAIVDGHAAGMSLRELAAASQLGVETVRRTLHAYGVREP